VERNADGRAQVETVEKQEPRGPQTPLEKVSVGLWVIAIVGMIIWASK
jgi:hypothetical protein